MGLAPASAMWYPLMDTTIKIANGTLDEVRFLHIPHEAQGKLRREDAGVLCLVFLKDVGLDRTAHLFEALRL